MITTRSFGSSSISSPRRPPLTKIVVWSSAAAQPSTVVVTELVNELATVEQHVVLVLDDLHVIEAVEIHEALGFLIDHLPSRTRLVVATRVDPPLPLARLRGRGELLEIRAADLRFTTSEAATYFEYTLDMVLRSQRVP